VNSNIKPITGAGGLFAGLVRFSLLPEAKPIIRDVRSSPYWGVPSYLRSFLYLLFRYASRYFYSVIHRFIRFPRFAPGFAGRFADRRDFISANLCFPRSG
jgi:hypothetical protein